MGTVQFVGQPPYAMPMPLNVKAYAARDGVDMHIRVEVGSRSLQNITISLTIDQALLLARLLSVAAEDALATKPT
ncbi:MAG TPA: hypothetical protein VNX86_06255 [Rhizomicrobium sp.]|jgi:hypothetical protein|nr:hypothetical protein [Rhizomicrobium sp.]